jgi:hypothetical protein
MTLTIDAKKKNKPPARYGFRSRFCQAIWIFTDGKAAAAVSSLVFFRLL